MVSSARSDSARRSVMRAKAAPDSSATRQAAASARNPSAPGDSAISSRRAGTSPPSLAAAETTSRSGQAVAAPASAAAGGRPALSSAASTSQASITAARFAAAARRWTERARCLTITVAMTPSVTMTTTTDGSMEAEIKMLRATTALMSPSRRPADRANEPAPAPVAPRLRRGVRLDRGGLPEPREAAGPRALPGRRVELARGAGLTRRRAGAGCWVARTGWGLPGRALLRLRCRGGGGRGWAMERVRLRQLLS